jgi:hypothetical protein
MRRSQLVSEVVAMTGYHREVGIRPALSALAVQNPSSHRDGGQLPEGFGSSWRRPSRQSQIVVSGSTPDCTIGWNTPSVGNSMRPDRKTSRKAFPGLGGAQRALRYTSALGEPTNARRDAEWLLLTWITVRAVYPPAVV